MGTNSVLPGAVANTAAPDEGFKGNKYQRKIAASSVNSRATGYEVPVSVESSKSDKSMEMGTKSVQPGAVADTAAPDAGFKGNKYQRKIAASTVNSKATGYEVPVSGESSKSDKSMEMG